jgi:hypothetical protein
MSPGCIAGFFPTVAWPSEAVRVCDDSITFIQKRVADPFTGREAFLIQSEPKRSLLGGLVKSPNRWRWLAHRG